MASSTLIPILLAVIALFAGFLNLFIAFILKVIWTEIKDGEKKYETEIDKIYDHLRGYQSKIDDQLHAIKTEIVKISVKMKTDE